MGLISLPVLNKVSHTNYWSNLWDSNLLFKKYFFLSIFLNKYFNLLFVDYTLTFLLNLIKKNNLKKGYYIYSTLKKKLFKNYFLGKVWVLKYQNSYLVVVNIFNTNLTSVSNKSQSNILKKWKNYFNYSYNQIKLNKVNYLNYKHNL
nr:ribosomal protein S3 [Pseudocohnilembus persalinus]